MTNRKLSLDYLQQAQARKRFLSDAFDHQQWHIVVRVSQEIVELSLKAALRFAGVEPPRWHDVAFILGRETHRFPPFFQNEIRFLQSASSELRKSRELSFYGDDEHGRPASELFSEENAREAKEHAEKIFSLCTKLIEEPQR